MGLSIVNEGSNMATASKFEMTENKVEVYKHPHKVCLV